MTHRARRSSLTTGRLSPRYVTAHTRRLENTSSVTFAGLISLIS